FEGQTFRSKIAYTIVSGNLAWENGQLQDIIPGKRLLFNR
ncbi:MAG TPA: hypothetical protein DIT07_00230, partial [Sphingobacteriaceae bacterium]|nr:hypothetical protein [Sphingobacteriaceae bacterium]